MGSISSSPGVVLFGFGYPVSRDEYFSMFRNERFQFLTASSGDEFLSLFYAHPGLSLVILTVEMGGMNGFEILHQIKITRSGLPVILLSAGISFESLKLASMYNCNELLQLPLHKDDFITLINKYLYQQ
jgi:DNA-binding response OmpR family regulator